MSLPEHLRGNAFFKVWTAKEALLKAVGTGLSAGMTHFSVIGERDGVTGIASVQPQPLPHEQCDVHYSQWGAGFDATWCSVPAHYTACVAWSRESH
jgi:4'-phosphopantetheinyl transferase